jgi:flagellar biosynthesis regulator FlbT
LELVPLADQLVPQRLKVLDDAVVDQRQFTALVEVRVSIAVGNATMGRPSGMADSGSSANRVLLDQLG